MRRKLIKYINTLDGGDGAAPNRDEALYGTTQIRDVHLRVVGREISEAVATHVLDLVAAANARSRRGARDTDASDSAATTAKFNTVAARDATKEPLLMLAGPAGVGKTTTSRNFIELLRAASPAACVMLDQCEYTANIVVTTGTVIGAKKQLFATYAMHVLSDFSIRDASLTYDEEKALSDLDMVDLSALLEACAIKGGRMKAPTGRANRALVFVHLDEAQAADTNCLVRLLKELNETRHPGFSGPTFIPVVVGTNVRKLHAACRLSSSAAPVRMILGPLHDDAVQLLGKSLCGAPGTELTADFADYLSQAGGNPRLVMLLAAAASMTPDEWAKEAGSFGLLTIDPARVAAFNTDVVGVSTHANRLLREATTRALGRIDAVCRLDEVLSEVDNPLRFLLHVTALAMGGATCEWDTHLLGSNRTVNDAVDAGLVQVASTNRGSATPGNLTLCVPELIVREFAAKLKNMMASPTSAMA